MNRSLSFNFQAHAQKLMQATPPETLLVIDEAYYEYALHSPGFPDALAELRAQSRPWIVLRTFSKAWGLAGLRVGYGIASDDRLVQMLDRVRTPFNVNVAAQTAALAAQLRSMGVVVAPSATNFLFLNLQRPNGPVAEALLARGVVVKPWKEMGYESFIRVSIASVDDNVLFLQAFSEAMRASA